MAYLRPGDTLIVWKLGRSLPHLVQAIESLRERGVGFQSLTEAINTGTPGGNLGFNLFASLAEFERDLMRERTRAGLNAAAAHGRIGGRRFVITPEKLQRAQKLIGKGLTVRETAAVIKVGKTAYEALKADNDGQDEQQ